MMDFAAAIPAIRTVIAVPVLAFTLVSVAVMMAIAVMSSVMTFTVISTRSG